MKENNAGNDENVDKKPYESPHFVEYGDVTLLTQNSMMGSCPDAEGRNEMQCN